MKKTPPFSSLFLFLCLLISSCSQKENHSQTTQSPYKAGNIAFFEPLPQIFDPIFAQETSQKQVIAQIYSPLFRLGEEGILYKNLLQSYTILDSGKTYEFTLRRDIFFHPHATFDDKTQRQLTAHDVIFSLKRWANSPSGALFRNFLENRNQDWQKAFVFQDAFRFQIRLGKPTGLLPHFLALPESGIVSAKVLQRAGISFEKNKEIKQDLAIGTGAYLLEEVRKNSIILKKHEDFFGKNDQEKPFPYVHQWELFYYQDTAYLAWLFEKEKIAALLLTPDLYPSLDSNFSTSIQKKIPNLELKTFPLLAVSLLQFEKTQQADLDALLRRNIFRFALNLSVDRKKRKNSLQNVENQGFIPQILPQYTQSSLQGYLPDTLKARTFALQSYQDLLAAQGREIAPDAFKNDSLYQAAFWAALPTLTLSTADFEWQNALLDSLIQDWQRVGIKIERQKANTKNAKKQANLTYQTLYSPIAEEIGLLMQFPNECPYLPADFYQNLAAIWQVESEPRRKELYLALQKIWLHHAPAIVLFYPKNYVFYNPNQIIDLKSNLLGLWNLAEADLKIESE
jgi:ABC-type transport system substrate-binding protein